MNRKYLRLAFVVALLLALNFAILPTAEARSLSGSRTAATGTQDLWSAALAWVRNLLPGDSGRSVRHVSSATTTGGRIGGGYQTLGHNVCVPGQ
jgi:hypothetical protein